MMKARIVFLLVLFGSSFVAWSQELKFSLVNSETMEPIEGVEIFSHESHDKVVLSDKIGEASFDINHTDTLIFFKQLFHPLYIQVKRIDFDKNHKVVLKMVPTNGETHGYMTRQFDMLQKSEYHFVHDKFSNRSIQIVNFKSPSLAGTPQYNDKSFHVAEIDLDKKAPTSGKSSYLKKK